MSMKRKANELIDGIRDLTNKIISKNMDLKSIANIDSEDLRLLKETNDLLEQSYDFAVEEVGMIEETHDQVEELTKEMKEVNRKLNVILSKLQEGKKIKAE